MIEVDVTIVIRQRKTFPKELPCSWPPYSSGFNTEWDKLNATRYKVTPPSNSSLPRLLLLPLPPLSPCARVCVGGRPPRGASAPAARLHRAGLTNNRLCQWADTRLTAVT